MINNFVTDNKKILIISILFSFLLMLLIPFAWIGIILVVFIIISQIFPTKTIILFSIFSLLVVSSDIDEVLRTALTLSVLIFLVYILLKDYGFQLSSYPKLPIIIEGYALYTIFVMIFSSLFSDNILIGFNETLRQILFFVILYSFLYI